MTDRADDLEAIRLTLATYNVSGDRGQLAKLAAAFAPDGVLETSTSKLEGRDEIATGLGGGPPDPSAPREPPRRSFVRHNQTTQLLELTGPDTAEGRTQFVVYTDVGQDHMGTYVDRFRKVDGAWLIQHRRVFIEWMHPETTSGNRGHPTQLAP